MDNQPEIQELIDSRIQATISQYRKIFYGFLAGLGVLIVVTVGSGLIAKQSLIVLLHDVLFELKEERDLSMVVVTHNQELAERTDRILLMKEGVLHSVTSAVSGERYG